jgi:hypothetical protein
MLFADCESSAQLAIEALPSFRIAGGMGATHLLEGWNRLEVEALFRLRGLSAEQQRITWDDFSAMEPAIRDVLAERRARYEAELKSKTDKKQIHRIGRGRTIGSLINGKTA